MALGTFDATKIVKGSDLMIFDQTTGKSFAYATSHTLTISPKTSEINCKDVGFWGATIVTGMAWEVSSENLFVEDYGYSMLDKTIGATLVKIRIGVKQSESFDEVSNVSGDENEAWSTKETSAVSTDTATYYEGQAYITSYSINAAAGENCTMSMTLTGVGALTKVAGTKAGE